MPIFEPRYAGLAMLWAAGGALIVILWWLLFSRARWYERLGAIVLMIAAMIPERSVVHPSISGGAMGYLSYILTIPTLSVALVAWAAASRRLAPGARAAGSGRGRPARMPAVDGDPDRRHQRRRTVGFPLALDEDARGAAARSGLGTNPGRRSGSGRRGVTESTAPGDARRAPRRGWGQARQDGTGRCARRR